MKKSGNTRRIILLLLAIAVVIVFCIIAFGQIFRLSTKNAELEERKERLEAMIEEQERRREELEEAGVYVQTLKYIEEKAKSIGYVYPDEIIFKREDD